VFRFTPKTANIVVMRYGRVGVPNLNRCGEQLPAQDPT